MKKIYIFGGKGAYPRQMEEMRDYTDKKVTDALTSIYTLAGACLFSELPPLTEEYLGFVHDVTEDFTTTSDFVEGSGKKFPAGTNVTVVNAGTKANPVYKYDASIGDLSAFQTRELSSAIGSYSTVEGALSGHETAIGNKVDRHGTDSLMTADEHTKLEGVESGAEVNVQSDWTQDDNTADDYIKHKPALGSASGKDFTTFVSPDNTDLPTADVVYKALSAAIYGAFHPSGSKTIAQLTSDLLVLANVGNVYKVTDSGVTDSNWVGGAGQTINANDNAVVVFGNEPDTFLFDLQHGINIDMSAYQQKALATPLTINGHVKSSVEDALSALVTSDSAKLNMANIAPVETSATSSSTYSAGDFLIYNGILYKVTESIAQDDTITVGTNVTPTTIMAEIRNCLQLS